MYTGAPQVLNPGPVLYVLGQTMLAACKAAGDGDILGFAQGFKSDVKAYVKKNYGKTPSSSDVVGYMGGLNPKNKKNFFEGKTSTPAAAQSAWKDLHMVVGSGQKNDTSGKASYGLPHSLSRGNVGRYCGVLHVGHPREVHVRLFWNQYGSVDNPMAKFRNESNYERKWCIWTSV